jgi:GNAT superfamily N-acetyltransferase
MVWRMHVSADAVDAARIVTAEVVARRWQAIDRLLPAPGAPPSGCGAEFIVAGAGGQPAATGTCEHWAGTPESLELTWGAARRFHLTAWIAGPGVGPALDQLLAQWRDHLAGVPGSDAADSAAVVTWPSRDIEGAGTLVRRGLTPLAVIAARIPSRHPAGPAENPARPADGTTGTASRGLRIRRAGPADIDAVVRLGMEVIRFDAHFGGVTERPGTADALRREAAGLLAGPEAWMWLAERDGTPVGMLAAERPESASWIAPMVRPAPVAYVLLLGVLPDERGSGVGAALTARLHRVTDEAGVAVTLLHYAQVNPLSAPFWSQQGYRPLWTCWEARPARSIR